jgi:hypothetical protein
MTLNFPLPYRWFITKGLTNWQPWSFIDSIASISSPPDLNANTFLTSAFKTETGADFGVYLFARRQDRDDFAFFVVKDGVIENKVVSIHLSFADKLELRRPLRYGDIGGDFGAWIQTTVIRDVDDWMSEDDLNDV